MKEYHCYIGATQVGTVDAEGSLEAREKAKEKFEDEAESEWNVKKQIKSK